jgi:ATP-dependent protease ClpP protease subunit
MKNLLGLLVAGLILLGSVIPAGGVTEKINDNTIMIYGAISIHDGLQLRKFTAGDQIWYHLVINTKGGLAMFMQDMVYAILDLQRRGVHIITEVTAFACSAGAVLWMMGDERIAHDNSMIMFHKAWQPNPWGKPTDAKDIDEHDQMILDNFDDVMFKVVEKIVGEERAKLLITDEDVWVNGEVAYKLGLATKLLP